MKYISKDSRQFFAFNVWSMRSAQAVMDAGVDLHYSLILQTSSNVFKSIDKMLFRKFITDYSRKTEVSVYIHLDHSHDLEMISEAVAAGWDSVMIDASDLSIGDNVAMTNKVVDLCAGSDVLVEAEVGRIAGTEDRISCLEVGVARLEDIKNMLSCARADILAVAVGTAHGVYKKAPEIRFDLLQTISKMTDLPIVIHGGSGLSDETLKDLLAYENIKKINFSTDVKLSFRKGIENCRNTKLYSSNTFDAQLAERNIYGEITKMVHEKLLLLKTCKNLTE